MPDIPGDAVAAEEQGPAVYRGRFAPSPTGPLHFGSLVAAVGSYLDACRQGGDWLLRIEDVDTARTVPGAADEILKTLEKLGFEWEGSVLWQSQRFDAYAEALEQLKAEGRVYACMCSRKEIADSASHMAIDGGLAYPGTCRNGIQPGRVARSWRLRVDNRCTAFEDRLQGRVAQHLESDVGDFVLLRADGIFAYQLAVVVDDHFQGVTDVVRGADLLASTPRQLWLQHCFDYPNPRYAHLPLVCNAAGEKLSKQTLAPAVNMADASAELWRAIRFLGQQIPEELAVAPLSEIWDWALAHWDISAVLRSQFLKA